MSKGFKKFWEILRDSKRLQQNKFKKVGIINVLNSIVIEGISNWGY